MPIQFFFADATITFKEKKKLKQFIEALFSKEGKSLASLNYVFCSDKYLLTINKTFLKHNNYTDIITFNISPSKSPIEGEVYISVDRVKENAVIFKKSIKNELHRLIFHGALHLCGYKDKAKTEIKTMRKTEEKYLNLYFDVGFSGKVSRGTIFK